MAKITFSISPGPEGGAYSSITAEGEPNEVDTMTQAVDKLMGKYPVLKPKPKPEDMSAKEKITHGITLTR
jgi:hypothetical protein